MSLASGMMTLRGPLGSMMDVRPDPLLRALQSATPQRRQRFVRWTAGMARKLYRAGLQNRALSVAEWGWRA